MIPLDRLRAVTHLITHANCPDGVASALIVKDSLPDVRVSFVKYGSEEHMNLVPTPGTLFCDFSPWLPKEGAASVWGHDMRAVAITSWREAGVIVLDHHTRDVVEPYGELGVFGENERLECGAMLAFKHVWLPLKQGLFLEQPCRCGIDQHTVFDHVRTEVLDFARLAAVRDTWKKDDFRWKDACEQAAELVFWRFEDMELSAMRGGLRSKRPVDERLFERQLSAARTAISESHRFTSGKGTRVLMFQGVSATSDAAELLDKTVDEMPGATRARERVDLVAGFHYRTDAGKLQLQFSCRSHIGYDCQAFARAHGGNGHRAAAGFTVEVSPEVGGNPYAVFRELLEEWEGAR